MPPTGNSEEGRAKGAILYDRISDAYGSNRDYFYNKEESYRCHIRRTEEYHGGIVRIPANAMWAILRKEQKRRPWARTKQTTKET
jgi:hypothetical protein